MMNPEIQARRDAAWALYSEANYRVTQLEIDLLRAKAEAQEKYMHYDRIKDEDCAWSREHNLGYGAAKVGQVEGSA